MSLTCIASRKRAAAFQLQRLENAETLRDQIVVLTRKCNKEGDDSLKSREQLFSIVLNAVGEVEARDDDPSCEQADGGVHGSVRRSTYWEYRLAVRGVGCSQCRLN